jgi:outer membrane protein assembly factor BamD (BamD/ComL family)
VKFLIKNLLLLFCICVFSVCIKAQSEITEPAPLPLKKFQCTSELFNKAEYYFRTRKLRGSEFQFQVEYHIKKILDVCPNAELMPYLQEQLEILEEEKAEINFIVGDYYLKQAIKFQNRGLNGAKFRFLEIVEKYPNYSKTVEVLFLLGETYLLEKEFDKAEEYFQKVIKQFPESEFATQAKEKIQVNNFKNTYNVP